MSRMVTFNGATNTTFDPVWLFGSSPIFDSPAGCSDPFRYEENPAVMRIASALIPSAFAGRRFRARLSEF